MVVVCKIRTAPRCRTHGRGRGAAPIAVDECGPGALVGRLLPPASAPLAPSRTSGSKSRGYPRGGA
jgi:hypothetical protein